MSTLKPCVSGFDGTRAFPDGQNSWYKMPEEIVIRCPHFFHVTLLQFPYMYMRKWQTRLVCCLKSRPPNSMYTCTGSPANRQNWIFLAKIEFISLATLLDEPEFGINENRINRVLAYIFGTTWHNPNELIQLFKNLCSFKLCFVVLLFQVSSVLCMQSPILCVT